MTLKSKSIYPLKHTLLLFLLLFTSGCVYNGKLFDKNRITFSPEQIIRDDNENGVNFTIRTNYWHGSPKNLNRHILPVFISVENNSDTPIIIERGDIVVLDDSRNQYSALPPDDVAKILLSSERYGYSRIYPSISIGIGSYYNHGHYYYGHRYYHPFYRHRLFYDDYPYYDYPRTYYRPDYKDIYTEAFQPGKIMPDARSSGFVYFKKLTPYTSGMTLQINYRTPDSKELHSLDFYFDALRGGETR